jgi:tetratricopeptide (TPR) repeat protein
MRINKLSQPRTSPRQKIALVLFGLFLFFILLEVGLRLGGFILLSTQERRNLQSLKQKGTYRILCLGESTTQGQYPPFLEEALNQRNIGVRFSVIDKGRSGTNTSAILGQVESYINEYHPDMVVTMMGINDWAVHIPLEIVTTPRGMLFIRSFRTYKLIRLLWLHILTKVKEAGFYKPNENGYALGNLPESGLKEGYADPILMEASFKEAIERNPQDDNAYYELGRFYRIQGKFSQSEDLSKKAIELNPKNDLVYAELGRLYLGQKRYIESEQALKKVISLNPKHDPAYVVLSWVYKDQGKLAEAEQILDQAIALNHKYDSAYVGLGQVYKAQKRLIEAEWVFKKAIELNPENELAYGGLATVYGEMGKNKLSSVYAEKADKLRDKLNDPVMINNYLKLKEILDRKGIRLVCVQYPMRSVEPLKEIFKKDEDVIFVDNEKLFKDVVRQEGYNEYFRDIFAGDFGHCTEKGNRFLAGNIANVILREVFGN